MADHVTDDHTREPHPDSIDGADGAAPPGPRRTLFDDRYGAGAYERLITWLRQPCVSFADIALRFEVSRERVRQWHRLFLPDAPTGLERRRRCARLHQRKRLLDDPLFAAFYRHARTQVDAGQIELIRSKDGYRRRLVRVSGRLLAIHDGSRLEQATRASGAPAYRVASSRCRAEFIYVRLGTTDFLVVPAAVLPRHGTTFLAEGTGRYVRYQNTFDALRTPGAGTIHPGLEPPAAQVSLVRPSEECV